jgi:pyrimidine-nucleoside phosphorylase
MKHFNMPELIALKRDGYELSHQQLTYWIDGYVKGEIPDYQVAALLMAIYIRGMKPREVADLTEIMMRSGETISLAGVDGMKIDKHSTGGVGDKVSFIVAPLAAACGVKAPMISGRGLGHTGGTLDKLESIPGFNVSLTSEGMLDVLRKTGMMICGQTANIVPADKKIYALRDITATVDSLPLIASSIMSKKLALGTDGLVLDVKTGSGAFMQTEEDALALCKALVDIGNRAGRNTIGLITNMDQPLGRAVGNSLEIAESIQCLKNNGPQDLMEISLAVASAMVVAGEAAATLEEARAKLEDVLKKGQALKIFRSFIEAQQGDPRVCDDESLLPTCSVAEEYSAPSKGFIQSIDARAIGELCVEAGAGRRTKEDAIDFGAGFYFHKKVGDPVEAGESIVSIHTCRPDKIPFIKERLREVITVGDTRVPAGPMVFAIVDRDGKRPWPSA